MVYFTLEKKVHGFAGNKTAWINTPVSWVILPSSIGWPQDYMQVVRQQEPGHITLVMDPGGEDSI